MYQSHLDWLDNLALNSETKTAKDHEEHIGVSYFI